MEIIAKKVKALTKEEYKKCSSLTLRETGSMQSNLSFFYKENPKDAWVYLIKEETTLLAWALVFPTYRQDVGAMFYVRKLERRKGLGRLLYKVIETEWFGKFEVYDDDDEAAMFFDRMEQEIG
jgi:predicted acetyltransferase